MSPEAWDALAKVAIAVASSGVLVEVIRTRRTVRRVETSTGPISDDFGGDVRTALAEIKADVRELRVSHSRHLSDHAGADLFHRDNHSTPR